MAFLNNPEGGHAFFKVLKVIKGDCIKVVNQLHHSCLKIKMEIYQNVSKTEENIKHLVL